MGPEFLAALAGETNELREGQREDKSSLADRRFPNLPNR